MEGAMWGMLKRVGHVEKGVSFLEDHPEACTKIVSVASPTSSSQEWGKFK